MSNKTKRPKKAPEPVKHRSTGSHDTEISIEERRQQMAKLDTSCEQQEDGADI